MATEQKPAPKPGGKGNLITRKYAGLPGWQWVGVVAGGLAIVVYLRKARQGATTTPDAQAAGGASNPSGFETGDGLGSGVDSTAGSSPLPGSDIYASLLANQSAQAAQISAGDAKLQGENNRQRVQITALQKAIAALTPKKQTAAKAVAAAKKPPAVKKNAVARPVTKPGGRTPPPPKAADLKAGMNYGAAVSQGLAPAPAKVH